MHQHRVQDGGASDSPQDGSGSGQDGSASGSGQDGGASVKDNGPKMAAVKMAADQDGDASGK
jgi:hypothetical protein